MPELAFVMSPSQDWFLREFAETLRYELDLQAVPSTMHSDGFPEPRPQTVYVLVAPQDYVTLEGQESLPDDEILARTILVCVEPPNEIEREENIGLIRRAGAVLCTDLRTVARLRRSAIPARHLKPGYSKLRDTLDPEAERPIDVMFLGARSLRRTRQLSRCARVLAGHNCVLQIADDSRPNPGASSSFLAEGKWDLLKRTKVILNIHRDEDAQLEWFRVLDAIHAGAVIVSEHSSGTEPLVPGEDLLVASPDSLPYVLEAALSDGELLGRLRTQAHERIRTLRPFALSASVFRAAAVEVVGRPAFATASLGRRASVAPDSWAPPPPNGEPGVMALRRNLKQVSVELTELRREVARLEHVLRASNDAPLTTQVAYETPAWSARPERQVTVIVILSDQGAMAEATLDSLVASRFRDFELVVVDDASTAEAVDVAREWMVMNARVPAVLVGHPVSRGLGAARNTGLDLAKAPYCLILDAGDQLYPRGLEVLVGTLRAATSEVVFAYPIVEVTGLAEAFVAVGGDYLLNFFGWEPQRLRLWLRVHGLGLFRTDRLRELGGFATEAQLSGWEDHDLWCRVADHSWRGQLAPQILGRFYASRAKVANVSDIPPITALADRAPRLLAGVVEQLG